MNKKKLENDFIRNNEWIIYYALSKYPWVYDSEDIIQEARMWLFLAKKKFDSKKSSWKTFASNYIKWRYKSHLTNLNTKGRSEKLSGFSNINIDLIDENELSIIMDDGRENTEADLVYDSAMKSIKNPRNRNIVIMHLSGYTFDTIGKRFNITKQAVHLIYKKEMLRIKERVMRKDKCYIAGPIKGKENNNADAFTYGSKYVTWLGYVPVNPLELEKSLINPTLEQILKNDFEELLKCQAIHLLDGWEKSKGATLEYSIAKAIGLKVI